MLAGNGSVLLKTSAHGEAKPRFFDHPAFAAIIALAAIGLFSWKQMQSLGGVLQFQFPNPDDAMRLMMVRDFLAGQSWFDTTQYRFLPPAGLSMHWSRLLDLPLAGSIAALRPFVGATLAEGITIAAWPPLLFAAYLGIIGFLLHRTSGLAGVAFGFLIASQMNMLFFLFGAGRIDHHNVEGVLVAAAAVCFIFSDRTARAAIVGGLLSALALAISLESLPFVAGIAVLYGLTWVFDGERGRQSLLGFFGALLIGALLLHAVQTLPSRWLEAKCDALSPPWLLLAAGGCAATAILARLSRNLPNWRQRLGAAALAGGAVLAVFAIAYPACLHGPYAAIPEPFRTLLLGDIAEARSFAALVKTRPFIAFEILGPIVIAAIIATAMLLQNRASWRMAAALAMMLWIGAALCLVEIRGAYIGSVFVPIVGGWALHRALVQLSAPGRAKARAATLLCATLFLFGTPWIVGVSVARGFGFLAGGEVAKSGTCVGALPRLNELPKGAVLAPIDLSIPVLLHTGHSMVTTGYHRGVAGVVAGIEAFFGPEAAMRRHAVARNADYVVLCAPWFAGEPRFSGAFARDLAEGGATSWLEPIKLDAGSLMIWRVVR